MTETKDQLISRLARLQQINKELGGNLVALLEIRSVKEKIEKLSK
jgi:hypothetical protein